MELIEGLTLLSTEVYGEFAWLLYFPLALLVVGMVLVLFIAINSVLSREYGTLFLFVVLSLCLFVLGYICIDHANNPPTTVYKVTIDDTVSIVEFYERYEIIDQDGLIFTIAEKEAS